MKGWCAKGSGQRRLTRPTRLGACAGSLFETIRAVHFIARSPRARNSRLIYWFPCWLATMLLVAAGTTRSAQPAKARFEFVSLRRVPPLCGAIELSLRCQWQAAPPATLRVFPGGRFEVANQPAIDLVRLAYGLESIGPKYLSGGPDWLRSERYDIVALTGDDGRPEQERGAMIAKIRLMLRDLLEDRFRLRVRIEKLASIGRP